VDTRDLIGRYRLVSWHRADGTAGFGERPEGHLHYAPDGRVSVMVARSDRHPLGLDYEAMARTRIALRRPWTLLYRPRVLRAVRRLADAAAGFAGYEAAYRVEGNTVFHTVGVGLIPDRSGNQETRTLTIDGDRVTMETPEGDQLVWERLSHSAARE